MKKVWSLLVIGHLLFLPLLVTPTYGVDAGEEQLAALLAQLEGSSGAIVPDAPAIPEEPAVPAEPEAPVEEHQAAEAILDALDSDKRSYAGEEKIEIKEVTTSSAKIWTTQVKYDGQPVSKYKIYYAETTLAAVQDFNAMPNVIVDVAETSGSMVLLHFTNLEPNKTYYLVVAPVNPIDPLDEPLSFLSDETMFTTQQVVVAPAVTTQVFENVSYTYKDSMVTVTWTPTSAAQSAEIHLRHQSEAAYTKVGNAVLQQWTFSFAVSKPGTYFLKLIALNDAWVAVGQEHIQTIKVDEIVTPTQPVQAAPQVWPTTNILIGLMIVAFLSYGIFRFRRLEY